MVTNIEGLPNLAVIKLDPIKIDGKSENKLKNSMKIDYILSIVKTE